MVIWNYIDWIYFSELSCSEFIQFEVKICPVWVKLTICEFSAPPTDSVRTYPDSTRKTTIKPLFCPGRSDFRWEGSQKSHNTVRFKKKVM